jgi:phosphatidylglycerophosphatase A
MTRTWPYHIATAGGLGRLRPAPGTWTSLATLLPAWAAAVLGGGLAVAALAMIALLAGWWACQNLPERDDDPGWVVIDEVAGQLLALSVVPLSLPAWLAGFVLFRLFDIAKPFPIGWLDRTIPGATGIMADDAAAGIAAAGALLALHHFGWLPVA